MLFEAVWQLRETQIEGILILREVKISVTRMIEAGIDGLYIGDYMGFIMQDIYCLKFIPLHLGGGGWKYRLNWKCGLVLGEDRDW